jgi:hypothetical protein
MAAVSISAVSGGDRWGRAGSIAESQHDDACDPRHYRRDGVQRRPARHRCPRPRQAEQPDRDGCRTRPLPGEQPDPGGERGEHQRDAGDQDRLVRGAERADGELLRRCRSGVDQGRPDRQQRRRHRIHQRRHQVARAQGGARSDDPGQGG